MITTGYRRELYIEPSDFIPISRPSISYSLGYHNTPHSVTV